MTFTQHRPPFTQSDVPRLRIEGTLNEILAHPWLQDWTQDPRFTRFSVSPMAITNRVLLMAEMDGNKTWYVVGYLSECPPELPVWSKPASYPVSSQT